MLNLSPNQKNFRLMDAADVDRWTAQVDGFFLYYNAAHGRFEGGNPGTPTYLDIAGPVVASGSVTVLGVLAASGASFFSGDGRFKKNLAVEGNLQTLGSTSLGALTAGASALNTVQVSGVTTLNGGLALSGLTSLFSGANVSGVITITPGDGTGLRCLTLNSTQGATIFMNPASGTLRSNIKWGTTFQWITDTLDNGTGDLGIENLQSGNFVWRCTSTDLLTVGSTNTLGGAVLGAAGGRAGLYGATPVFQAGATSDLKTALTNFGLMPSGGVSPLNLNGGALTAGTASLASLTVTGSLVASQFPVATHFSSDASIGIRGWVIDKLDPREATPHGWSWAVSGAVKWEVGMDFDTLEGGGNADFVLINGFDPTGFNVDLLRGCPSTANPYGVTLWGWGGRTGTPAANAYFLNMRPSIGGYGYGLGGINLAVSGGTAYAAILDSSALLYDKPQTGLVVGYGPGGAGLDLSNRCINLQQILNVATVRNYVFTGGCLASGSTAGAPLFYSGFGSTFGLEGTDNNLSLVTAPPGNNQTPIRGLTMDNAGNLATGARLSSPGVNLLGATTANSATVTGTTTLNGILALTGTQVIQGGGGNGVSFKEAVPSPPTDADYTLTSSEAAAFILVAIAGSWTVGRNMILPATTGGMWMINNITGFTTTFKTAAGTGVAIANNKTAFCWSNGTNIIRATADV